MLAKLHSSDDTISPVWNHASGGKGIDAGVAAIEMQVGALSKVLANVDYRAFAGSNFMFMFSSFDIVLQSNWAS